MSAFSSTIFQNSVLRKGDKLEGQRLLSNLSVETFKNEILFETNKGLVCMSLNDTLNNGVGSHKLSIEDYQTATTELLFNEEQIGINECEKNAPRSGCKGISSKILKRMKKSGLKVKDDICSNSLLTSISENFSNSSVNLEDFRDMHESLTSSSLECTFLDKVDEVSNESSPNLENSSKILIEFELTSSQKDGSKKKILKQNDLVLNKNMKPVISLQKVVNNLPTRNETFLKKKHFNLASILINDNRIANNQKFNENCISCGETSDNSEIPIAVKNKLDNKPVKKRGGWPKGRKRKPEIKYEVRPPKAPATGYVIFLNERRKEYRDMPFTEVTKLLGNEWSKLNLLEKKVYLDQAEIEKKRYREELRLYRQSDAYQTYLNKKRLKKLQGNGTEESDMDATDEIDEEDNEELYCRSCDQWFHSLHNKKEHLYGRQHLQSIAGRCNKTFDPDWCNANMSSTSLDESSLDGSSYLKTTKEHCCSKDKDLLNMDDAIVRFMALNKEREEERRILQLKLQESKDRNQSLSLDLQQLNEILGGLTCMIESERTNQILLEQHLFNLLNVPTLFYLPEPLTDENNSYQST